MREIQETLFLKKKRLNLAEQNVSRKEKADLLFKSVNPRLLLQPWCVIHPPDRHQPKALDLLVSFIGFHSAPRQLIQLRLFF